MSQIRWYLNNTTVDGWQLLDQTAATAATLVNGWVVGTGLTNSSEFASGAAGDRASSTFTANTVPDGTLDTTLKDAMRSQFAWTGSFAAGNWTFQFAVVSTVQSGAADGQIVFRILKADANGANATEITSAQQATTIATNVAGTDVNITATWAAPAWTITNQYIFVQVAWKRTGAGGMTTTNIRLRTGSSTTVGTTGLTADFTLTVSGAFIGSTSYFPSDVLWTTNDAGARADGVQLNGAGYGYGQTLSGHSGQLTGVSLELFRAGTPVDDMYLEIHSDTMTGPLLGTSALVPLSTVSNSAFGWIKFTFGAQSITLSAGTTYWIRTALTRLAFDGTNMVTVGTSITDLYAGGELKTAAGAQFIANWDMRFRLYTSANFATVSTTQTVAGTAITSGSAAITGHVLTPVVSGQTIYSTARVLYTETLLFQYQGTTGSNTGQSDDSFVKSQTIAGHEGALTSVSLRLFRNLSPTVTLYLVVRESTYTGSVLATSLLLPLAAVSTSEGWVNFALVSPALLTGATTYWLNFHLTGDPTGGASYQYALTTNSGYGDGEYKQNGATVNATYDLQFRLYTGTSHTVAIEVPADQAVTGTTIGVGSGANAPTLASAIDLPSIASIARNLRDRTTVSTVLLGQGWAQSFTGTGTRPQRLAFWLARESMGSGGSGLATFQIFAATGTPGSTAKPTGAALTVSASVDIATLSNVPAYARVELVFPSSAPVLTIGVTYCVAISKDTEIPGDDVNDRMYAAASSTTAYTSNSALFSGGTWTQQFPNKLQFDLISESPALMFAPTVTPGAVTETGATIGVGSAVYEPTVVADAAGGITLVAEVSAAPGVSGGTSAAIDTTGATFIAMSVAWYAGPGPAVPSDSKGNAWVPLTSATYTSYQQQIFYSLGPTVGTGHTFTISGVGTYPAFFVYAYSGVGSYQTESGAGNTTSPIPSGSVTPSADGALILTGKCGSQVTTDSVTPGGSTLDSIPAAANNVQGSAAYYVQPTAAAVNPTWSWTGGTSGAYLVTSAVFLPGEPAQAITTATISVNRTLAVNDFPADDGFDIGISWQDFLGGHMCWGFECVPQATNVFNNSSWNAYPGSEFDLWSQLEVRAMDGQSYGGPTVRQGSDIDNSWYAYVVNYGSSGTQGGLGAARPTSLLKCVAGTITQLGSSVNVTLNVGDTIRVEAEGTTIRGKHNGVTIISVTDSALTDGNPGILTFYDDSPGGRPAWDNWAGGDFVQEGTSQAFAPTLPLLVHGAFIEPNLTDYSWLNHPVYATEESASFDSIVGESWSEYVGQEFTVGSAERLASIDLRSQCYGTPIDNVFVEIRSGGRDGTVIATSVAVSPLGAPDFGTVSAFLNFPFTTPVALSPGTVYAWVAKRDGAADLTNQFVIMECYLTSAGEPPGRVDYTNGILIWDGDAPGWDDGYADTYSFEYRLRYAPTIYAPTVALAGGALAKVQSTAKVSVTSALWIDIPFATPPTVGNGIVIAVAFNAGGPNESRVGGCYDSPNGHTFAVAVAGKAFFNNVNAVLYYLPKLDAVSAPYSVRVDFNTWSGNATAMGFEVANVDQGLIVDGIASTESVGSTNPILSGTTPAATADTLFTAVLYSSWGSNASLGSSTVVSASPVWYEELEELSRDKPSCEANTRVVTGQTGLTQSCNWTTTYANPTASVIAAFRTSPATVVVPAFIPATTFLFRPTVVGGAPTKLLHNDRTAGTGTGVLVQWPTASIGNTPVVGQGIVVPIITYEAVAAFNGTAVCTDSEGNILLQAATVASNGQTRLTIYYWPRLASVGGSYNVWVDFGMTVAYAVCGITVNNVKAGLTVDAVGGNFTNTVTTTTPSVTGGVATVDSLFNVAVVGSNGSQASIDVESVTPPWQVAFEELSFTAAIGEVDSRTRIGQTGLTQGCSWTFGTARPYATLCVGFKGLDGILTPLRIASTATLNRPTITGGVQARQPNRRRSAAVRYPVVRKRDPFFG